MKTTIDIINILWQRLNTSSLKTAISGGVYKTQRPLGSDKEDVVINCLPVVNVQYGAAVANVNLFVPAIQVGANGGSKGMPNSPRLNELAKLALAALSDQWQTDYNYDIQQVVGPMADDESDQHYMNIRIEFYLVNL